MGLHSCSTPAIPALKGWASLGYINTDSKGSLSYNESCLKSLVSPIYVGIPLLEGEESTEDTRTKHLQVSKVLSKGYMADCRDSVPGSETPQAGDLQYDREAKGT